MLEGGGGTEVLERRSYLASRSMLCLSFQGQAVIRESYEQKKVAGLREEHVGIFGRAVVRVRWKAD